MSAKVDCDDVKYKCDDVWLGIARNSFNKLRTACAAAPYYAKDIDDELRKAHATYKDLSLVGNKTDAEMKAEIDGLVQTGLIRGARQYFDDLRTTSIPDIKAEDIRTCINKANPGWSTTIGYEVLDTSGKRTDADMRAEVERRVKARYLEMARESFAELRKSGIPDIKVDSIESELKAAGVGYEALDPSGSKTAEEMKAEVKKRYLEARLGAPLSTLARTAPGAPARKESITDKIRRRLHI